MEAQQLPDNEGTQPPPEPNGQQEQQVSGDASGRDGSSPDGTSTSDAQGSEVEAYGEGATEPGDAPADGYASYTLQGATQLKYVDYQGIAHNFASEPWSMESLPYLLESTTVTASTLSENYGMTQSYQQLSDSYVMDLRSDLAGYAAGDLSFSSGLARLFDQAQYQDFLYSLSAGGAGQFESTVAHLVIDAIE